MSGKIGVEQVFRVSSGGDKLYLNITNLAKVFNLKKGDKLRVEIKEKILDTYRD